jgi:DNA (cytosine-5)-methyltransferase 1
MAHTPVSSSDSISEKRPKLPEQAGATVVTPIIGRVAEQLFNHAFQVVGEQQEQESDEVAEEIEIVKEHNEDPMSIIWGAPATKNKQFFTSVEIDGVEYQVSNFIYILIE